MDKEMTLEVLAKNKKRFTPILEKYLSNELIEFIGDEFFISPATDKKMYKYSYIGGLCDYIIDVTKIAKGINSSLPIDKSISIEKLNKVCILHAIGKTFQFTLQTNEYKRNNEGPFMYNKDLIAARTGERTLFYCNKYNTKIEEDEFYCILSFDKDECDLQEKYYGLLLTEILRQSIKLNNKI